jgi:tRNA nucleotidyltransferase (CCA-adding enzyme)
MHLLDAAGRVGDEAGMPVYAVGGFVRDLLLGVKNDDLDLTVEGDGIAFAQRLAAALGGSSRRPSAFGTAVVLAPDGHKIDVASARRETYQHPAALPRVEPGSIRDDLFRRDFSVNTLAFALNGPEAFVLLDWYGGRADLAEGCIRVLHNRSYRDDPTRIFRAIRLEQRFGFTLHLHTVRLLGRAVEKRWIEQLSGTRLWRELRLMLEGTSPIQCLTRLDEFGVLSQIDPALTLSPERVAMLARVADARTELVEIAPDVGTCAWLVYLAAARQGSPADVTRRICARLTLSPRIAETLTGGIAAVERAAHRLQSALEVPPSQIVAALQMVPLDLLPLLMGASPEREAHERIRQYLRTLRHVQPSLSGHDLKRLGVPQGQEARAAVRGSHHPR